MGLERGPWGGNAHDFRGRLGGPQQLRVPEGARGLSTEEAAERLRRFGPNALRTASRPSVAARFFAQFTDITVLALVVAAAIAVAIGFSEDSGQPLPSRFGDAFAIAVIVLINAVIGLLQERRAETALAALKDLTAPTARVLRDGAERTVPTRELVVGDVVVLEEGDRVPADLKLVETVRLHMDESALTGESEPVEKSISADATEHVPLAERMNMAFTGTHVESGRGVGVVVATGMHTELGRIADMLATVEAPETPLQRQLRLFGTRLVVGCVVVAALVFLVGTLRMHESIGVLFMTAVSLAVAAIPEGLPAVTTIVLAIGVERMAKRNAVVRRLSSVETLGAVDVICTDKTGTLTQNRMTVRRGATAATTFLVEWDAGSVHLRHESGEELSTFEDVALSHLLFGCSLPRSAKIIRMAGAESRVVGDSSEGALLVFADAVRASAGSHLVDYEIPFDRTRRMATVAVREAGGVVEYHHGVPEDLIQRAHSILDAHGDPIPLGVADRVRLLKQVEAWGREGLRVLALARGEAPAITLTGLVALNDPPRPEVADAARRATQAGIRTVIITGDHPSTAESIAREIGLTPRSVVLGSTIDEADDIELGKLAETADVIARAAPVHKLRFVRALSARGHVVAMTGDGVNDAPALRAAAIGIAMGKSGTDVAREAADIVLSDDNYATLVTAVEEGRIIFANITKFIFFLLSVNVGLVAAVFMAALLGWQSLLTPTQILWINLVTNGLPALALGMERVHLDHMVRKPRDPSSGFISSHGAIWIAGYGALIAISGLGVFAAYHSDLGKARSMAFTVLALAPVFYAFSCRSRTRSAFELGLFSNRMLLVAVAVALGLQAIALYVPALSSMFHTTPLELRDLLTALLIASAVCVVAEMEKLVRRRVHSLDDWENKGRAARSTST